MASTKADLSAAQWRKSSYSNGSGGECVEVATVWRKSSYSNGTGGECVEVATPWRKSSHSNGTGGDCLEVAEGHPGVVPVRDSKRAQDDGHVLVFPTATWTAFVTSLKH